MILINEWLPNPAGKDAEGEWVELINNGEKEISISEWRIENKNGSAYVFSNTSIAPHAYFVLKRQQSKIILRNENEAIQLYDTQGNRIDFSEFRGAAPEGKSFSRAQEQFIFSEPTPGASNNGAASGIAIIESAYPLHSPLNISSLGAAHMIGAMMGIGLLLAFAVLFFLKRNNGLSKLFFNRDRTIR